MRSGPALLGALSALAVVGATTAFTLGTPSPASAATAVVGRERRPVR